MDIYIVGKILDNKSKDIGYILLDLDDNNKTMKVTKQQLVNVMKAKKIKINNAKLVENHIVGKYYSLSLLSYIKDGEFYFNKKHVCLKNVFDRDFTFCLVRNDSVFVHYLNNYDAKKLIMQGSVANVDANGNLLCYTENENNYTQKQSTKRNLDKEVLDENIVWTTEDFETYMKSHGYTYELIPKYIYDKKSYDLNNIDCRCENVKIPDKVEFIANLFNGKVERINSLIISGTVNTIRNLWSSRVAEEVVVVNNLVFQKYSGNNLAFTGSALSYLVIPGKLNLPDYKQLHLTFCGCNIREVRIDSKIERLYNSFNNIKLHNSVVNLNCGTVERSFRKVNNISTVNIGENVGYISESFTEYNGTTLKFEDNNKIYKISQSFKEAHNLFEVDLSRCTKLRVIEYSFCETSKVSKLEMPKNLISIFGKFLLNSRVKTLALPEGMDTFLAITSFEKIIYPKNITTLRLGTKGSLKGNNIAELEFTGGLKMIDFSEFSETDVELDSINELKTDFSQCKFSDNAFNNLGFKYFDSRDFKSLEEITQYCFCNNQNLKYVILGNSIKKISKYAFKDCITLEKVFIDKNVEYIDPKAFSVTHSKNLVIYVVKGSYAHKVLSKSKNNYNINIVDNIDTTIEDIMNFGATEGQRAKYIVMLSGTKYSSLLEEPYINTINTSYKILNKLNNNEEAYKLNLDTSKFVEIELNKYEVISNEIKYEMSVSKDMESTEKFDNAFISLSNLITKLYDNCDLLYRYEEINNLVRYMNDTAEFKLKALYSDMTRCIVSFNYIDNKEHLLRILAIIIEDKIVFMTPFNIVPVENSCVKLNLIDDIIGDFRFNIVDYFKKGDILDFYTRLVISGAEIPTNWSSNIKRLLNFRLKYIGMLESSKKKLDGTKKMSKRNLNILFYDTITSKFLEVSAIIETTTVKLNYVFNGLESFIVVDTYTLDEIDKINKEYFSDLDAAFNDKVNYNIIKKNTLQYQEAEQMLKDENFELNENKHFVDFADACYKFNVENIEEMTLPVAQQFLLIDIIDNEAKTFSLNECIKKKFEATIYELKNTDKVLVEYKINNTTYLIGIIDGDTNMKSKSVLKLCCISASKLLKMMYYIGQHRSIQVIKHYNYVDNDKLNTDEYFFINSIIVYLNNSCSYKLNLAIDKCSGYSFAIVEYCDMDFYKLFRFKKASYAFRFISDVMSKSEVNHVAYRSALDLHSKTTEKSRNLMSELHEMIIDGLPNGFPIPFNDLGLFDMLAKQPKRLDTI